MSRTAPAKATSANLPSKTVTKRRPRLPSSDSAPEPDRTRADAANAQDVPEVGTALRLLRTQKGLSLDKLAAESGVSRAMLSQIELGRSAPTITVLWKISRALGVPFGALLGTEPASELMVQRASRSLVLSSMDGSFSTRALSPLDRPRSVEFYELRLAAESAEHADAHTPGTTENLVITAGTLELEIRGTSAVLEKGDSVFFHADSPHSYRNPGKTPVIAYLVMTYVGH